MIRQAVVRSVRNDSAGQGHFGASRGSRTHRGIDYETEPGAGILSPVNGVITKNGYCYSDDLSWRYVEVTDDKGHRHRIFYANPLFRKGKRVHKSMIIATSQNIAERYPDSGMVPHIHYEVISKAGRYLNPENLA